MGEIVVDVGYLHGRADSDMGLPSCLIRRSWAVAHEMGKLDALVAAGKRM